MNRSFKPIAALAFAYALLGVTALGLAVTPGFAAPIYPAAGVALAAVLIFGARMAVGVFLGCVVVQLFAPWFSGSGWGHGLPLLVVPVAATLQTLATAWLVRRFVGFPNALDAPKAILKFLVGVAPAGCLISASLSTASLTAGGILEPSQFSYHWWNWWIGDTLGVVVAAPILLVFFAQPREDWRGRTLGIAFPLVIVAILMCVAVSQVRRREAQHVQSEFAHRAEEVYRLVGKRLDAQVNTLLTLERLMAVSPDINRASWQEFVSPWIARYPGTQNFAWSPRVRHEDRLSFEARAREEHPDFEMKDAGPGQQSTASPPAAEYLPLLYIEPMEGNEAALGLNPLTQKGIGDAIRLSRKTGEPVATTAFDLVQGNKGQAAVAVVQAVFRPVYAGTAEQGLLGVVSGVFRMDDMMGATLDQHATEHLKLCLADDHSGRLQRLWGAPGCESRGLKTDALASRFPVRFAGRNWVLLVKGDQDFVAATHGWSVWMTLAVGLVMATMVSAFVLLTTGRTRRIEELVKRRTAELAHATEKLREQQTVLSQAQRIARMGSWEWDPADRWLTCSDEFGRILHLAECDNRVELDSVLGGLLPPDARRLQEALDLARSQPGIVELDCSQLLDDGHFDVLHFQIEGEWEGDALHRVRGTVQNVTALREAQAHIQFLARYDALTGLPNRVYWIERARSALAAAEHRQESAAVLFLDLDNFKTINDSLGHPVGDRLLTSVAQKLSACLREGDVLGRLGGDEFVVLLSRLGRNDDAALVATKLIDSLIAPTLLDGHELSVTVSIGIAVYPADGEDIDSLLKHADVAMYGAKQAGRNNYQFFMPEMKARATERLQLEGALRRAIERDELVLHYQPQLSVHDGRVHACEALVRWQHPERGLVPPMQFIPLAEETGLILSLGDWVLREACRQQAAWAREGVRLSIAVNISALQFQQPNFAARVEHIVRETGADPRSIELEITESALMTPTEDLIGRLTRIGSLGISLALDDFGTGYSSLAYLKRLPIERLKLDRSFVRDLPGDAEDAAIASATLSLARDLGMQVVAEGVETPEQREFLANRGCQTLQGYLISRPLPADPFREWYAAQAA